MAVVECKQRQLPWSLVTPKNEDERSRSEIYVTVSHQSHHLPSCAHIFCCCCCCCCCVIRTNVSAGRRYATQQTPFVTHDIVRGLLLVD
jgi:hypothetical protein